jgi:glycosyltransferase involved in cell wall biosynthesis
MAKDIIILCPYPSGKAPSQRFRFEQYILANDLSSNIMIRSFYSENGMKALYGHNLFIKLAYLVWFFVRRFSHVLEALFYQKVFIHRELAPVGPPIFEFVLKLFNKKYTYDFDDAIWLSNVSEVNRKFDFFKAYWKVSNIIKWANYITVGNGYLGNYAKQFNNAVEVLPSTVDMVNVHYLVKEHEQQVEQIKIGWTGSHTTSAKYLPQVIDIINELSEKYPIEFIVISNQEPDFEISNLHYIPWSKATEIEDLIKFDIGIMPIGTEEWEKGKCSFKAIQYMALGIPVVLSPYGNNLEVVEDGKSGLFAESKADWINALEKLILDVKLREELSNAGREKIKSDYSLKSQEGKYKKILI